MGWISGFKRELAKKCYYVDGHEYPEQLKHRAWFTDEYLRVLEFRSHRFVHLTLPEVTDFFDSLEDDNAKEMLDKVKHAFKGDNGEDMFEFHVDKHERLQQIANEKYGAFGGRVSIRKKPEDKPVIIFGQMKQSSMLTCRGLISGLILMEEGPSCRRQMVLV